MNEVQQLKARIRDAQAACSHVFKVDGAFTPPLESRVPGVYVGHTAGPVRVSGPDRHPDDPRGSTPDTVTPLYTLTCQLCDLTPRLRRDR